MSSNVGAEAEAAANEGATALSDRSVTAEFLCLRVTVLLARAGAAPEDTTGSELVLRLVAIQGISLPRLQLGFFNFTKLHCLRPKKFLSIPSQFRQA